MLPAGELSYLFRHAVVRDGAYQLMPPSRRADLHVIAADFLDAGNAAPQVLVDIADHLRAAARLSATGGNLAELQRREGAACAHAARALQSQYRSVDALAMWERVLANPALPETERHAAAIAGSELSETLGDVRRGEVMAMTVGDALKDGASLESDRLIARAMRSAGLAAMRTGRTQEASARWERGLAAAVRAGDRQMEGRMVCALANSPLLAMEAARAEAMFLRAAEIAREVGDDRGYRSARGNLAVLWGNSGRIDEALAAHAEVARISRDANDLVPMGRATGNLGVMLAVKKDYAGAEARYAEALDIARRASDLRGESVFLGALAIILDNQGRGDEAVATLLRALALVREYGDVHYECNQLGNLSDIYARQGRFAESEAGFNEALRIAHELGDRRQCGALLADRTVLLERTGRIDEAITSLRDAIGILRDVQDSVAEHRAVVSLARLLRSHASSDPAAQAEATELDARATATDPTRAR
jgi:tetratricopeptide (TPR) repeat protein